MLLHDLKDPRIGFVTVTEVKVTGDLERSLIHNVSLFGKPEEKKASLDALNKSRGSVRRELGQRLKIYYTPEITFLNTPLITVMHIDGLLKKIHKNEVKERACNEPRQRDRQEGGHG